MRESRVVILCEGDQLKYTTCLSRISYYVSANRTRLKSMDFLFGVVSALGQVPEGARITHLYVCWSWQPMIALRNRWWIYTFPCGIVAPAELPQILGAASTADPMIALKIRWWIYTFPCGIVAPAELPQILGAASTADPMFALKNRLWVYTLPCAIVAPAELPWILGAASTARLSNLTDCLLHLVTA